MKNEITYYHIFSHCNNSEKQDTKQNCNLFNEFLRPFIKRRECTRRIALGLFELFDCFLSKSITNDNLSLTAQWNIGL